MKYHIIVATSEGEEHRGQAASIDELFSILTHKEIQKVFAAEAFNGLQQLFEDKKIKDSEESYFGYVNRLSINFISDGHEITTLVFYF